MDRGFLGPIPVLSPEQSRGFLPLARRAPRPLDWDKGQAASSRAYYELATQPAITRVLTAVLGEDVVLWGASIVKRTPGAVHAWHSDIESCAPDGKTVSVWLGLENTTRDSSLQVIPFSHMFGTTVQEVRQKKGQPADAATADAVLEWARECDPRCELITPDMSDGDAMFFDGRLWHGSHNLLDRTRRALLIQYATPDTPIRIPDLNFLDWPFHQIEQPRPACILIRGSGEASANRIVPAPVADRREFGPELTSRVYPLRLPLPTDEETGWRPHHIFVGGTADLWGLSCHASSLGPGVTPHPPQAHADEELLLMLDGEADLILPDAQPDQQTTRLKAGQFVYYPAQFAHTLTTVGERPANYLMFKWQGSPSRTTKAMGYGLFEMLGDADDQAVEIGFRPTLVFDEPTSCLRRVHCHRSTLTAGAGYEPHADAYDVALVLLEGEIETLGVRVGPYGVVFYRAGEPHGIRNPGDGIAKYLAFEFHGRPGSPGDATVRPRRSRLSKIKDPRAWKRKAKRVVKGLRNPMRDA